MNDFGDLLSRAVQLHQSGRVAEAVRLYESLLMVQKDNPHILFLLGTALFQIGEHDRGVAYVKNSIDIQPTPASHCNLGVMFLTLKKIESAIKSFKASVKLDPRYVEGYCYLGAALREANRCNESIEVLNKAINLAPDSYYSYYNLGNSFRDIGNYNEAISAYNSSINLAPNFAEAYAARGITYFDLGKITDSLADYEVSLRLNPAIAEVFYNQAKAFGKLGMIPEAIRSYREAIQLKPNYPEAYNNLGVILDKTNQFSEAIRCLDKAVELRPGYAEVFSNRGGVLRRLGRPNEALASYDSSIALKPDFAEAYARRGDLLQDMGRFKEAIDCYDAALRYKPDLDGVLGLRLHAKMFCCDWKEFESESVQLIDNLKLGLNSSEPFITHALSDSPKVQRLCAEIYAEKKKFCNNFVQNFKLEKKPRIKIGYFSTDFGNHPVSHLVAGLLEEHDREKFEVLAFSLTKRNSDEWRERIVKGVDNFFDVGDMADYDVAALSRSLGVDVAIDLNGYTKNARINIFASRAAPIQVGYLGFLGTMGMSCFDYLLADPILIPSDARSFYREKIAYLSSYQCNDRAPKIADKVFTRSDAGLPGNAFVFCSFNNTFKITPQVFKSWMNILENVAGSVLWLFVGNEAAKINLQNEATRHGISRDRLIFANRVSLEAHLSRLTLADLFLDTYPYNAGATASNALRAGLPLLTRMGETFSSRYGASLLTAIQMPELIANSAYQYEKIAIEVATTPALSASLKVKLSKNLMDSQLFDLQSFTKDIERLYEAMYERALRDLEPDHLSFDFCSSKFGLIAT